MSKLTTFRFNNRNGSIVFEPPAGKRFLVQAIDGLAKVDEEKAAFMKTHHLFNKVFFVLSEPKSVSDMLRETSDAATGGIDIKERIRQQAEEGRKLMEARIAEEKVALGEGNPIIVSEVQSEPTSPNPPEGTLQDDTQVLPPPSPAKPKNPNRVAAMQRAIAAKEAKRAEREAAKNT